MQITFNLIHLVPFFLYLHNKKILTPSIWGILVIFRFIFDGTGHHYEIMGLKAIYHVNAALAVQLLLKYILFFIPSYIICIQYIFSFRTKHP